MRLEQTGGLQGGAGCLQGAAGGEGGLQRGQGRAVPRGGEGLEGAVVQRHNGRLLLASAAGEIREQSGGHQRQVHREDGRDRRWRRRQRMDEGAQGTGLGLVFNSAEAEGAPGLLGAAGKE